MMMICFTNGLLAENGHLVEKDLWIDERRGIILDAQQTFYVTKERPDRIIDLGGNILSPGFLDIQINGAYGFDFSIYEGDDRAYTRGLRTVAEKIVETGVTSLVPTIITQEKSLYPKLLSLLRPFSSPNSATLLGWHAEGPFLQLAKRGAHAPSLLLSAPEGYRSFEAIYGADNLAEAEHWLTPTDLEHSDRVGVRIITAAPEINGVMDAVKELTRKAIIFSIGHSIATNDVATAAVKRGARLITHLFNAMPQLHHRDPSIIGLLASSPYLCLPSPSVPSMSPAQGTRDHKDFPHLKSTAGGATSEAFDNIGTPPFTPIFSAHHAWGGTITPLDPSSTDGNKAPSQLPDEHLPDVGFQRPFYGIIVDGIHSHPNSVRLAYSAHPEGCILVTDAMKILDPHLHDGIHDWRDGQRFIKEGDKLYLEGTSTLAGSVVTMDKCIRNFWRFTGCSLAEAIKCATYNPVKCLGIENRKGTLRPGADADLVVLDRKGYIMSTKELEFFIRIIRIMSTLFHMYSFR